MDAEVERKRERMRIPQREVVEYALPPSPCRHTAVTANKTTRTKPTPQRRKPFAKETSTDIPTPDIGQEQEASHILARPSTKLHFSDWPAQ
jgi:hypothetical protein